ncbi:MAG: hypothetical protein US53_C0009G0003 [Candidatus Woesebacteria bacterium GW2011_GWA1_37_7]|uniref:Prepilin-type N-terminal cleavage/methylation domain-containing protein n=1 Tax=Candidatus Woesebacteria bacterium GW2011_GWA1_37_7 TaxID=1618545 RepID=A0A0G0H6K6_9BACT|nr:MAG: hypothetical protein US53_C0009G0003 [Candidatus Woesebacteria bacterium GW2011_GWA1_37_7]
MSKKTNGGFTLIEILISSALLVILAAGFLGIQYIFSQNQVTAWNNYMNIEDSNLTVSKFIKEIRDARQSAAGTYFLETAGDTEIIFYSDIDYDSDVERVRYTISGSDLIKGVIKPIEGATPYLVANEKVSVITGIVRNGTDPLFYYYDENWPSDTVNNPLALASRIADTTFVKIILKVNPEEDNPDNDFTLESATVIRYTKTTL